MYQSAERVQQLTELTTKLPGCRALNRDQSLFEVPVHLRDGRLINLRISLPPTFPTGRPGLAVTQPLRHPWVNMEGRMSFPSLDAWTPGRSRLAAVVADAQKGLWGEPGSSTSPNRPGSGQASPASPSRAPTVPTEFPELATLSTEELTELLCDEAKYTAFVQSQAARAHIIQVKSQLRRGNAELARSTLAKESLLGELRNQIAIIRSSEYAAVKESFEEKYKRQQAVVKPLQPSSLIEALARAAAAADAESDHVYDNFLQGDMSVDAFLNKYVETRRLYHQRELKRQAAQQTL